MKARVKATGEIVDIEDMSIVTYKSDDGTYVKTLIKNFTFIDAEKDYYTKLEHQYAGMAMQGMIKTYEQMMRDDIACKMDCCEHVDAYVANGVLRSHADACAEFCVEFAHALVEKLKEERK